MSVSHEAATSPTSVSASSDGDMDLDSVVSSDTATNGYRSDHEATPRPEPINERAPINIMPLLGRMEQRVERYDVSIVGAGPAGLMLGLTLARLGITPLILDERSEQTPAGRADGMQPKTIETLRMLRLADELLQQGVKVFDICLWHSSSTATTTRPAQASSADGSDAHPPPLMLPPNTPGMLRRVGRETHYPAFIVDLADPFILIGHQGMVERVFVADLARRGVSVRRSHRYEGVVAGSEHNDDEGMMEVRASFNVARSPRSFRTSYLVGCDGAHSRVRRLVVPPPPAGSVARDDESAMSAWGVLDGEVETDFPDIWTKTVVFSEGNGSILIMPRERDMTRLYIEMRPDATDVMSASPATATAGGPNPELVQAAIMRRAALILRPYRIRWRRVEWFGQYRVSQRVAPRFAAPLPKAEPVDTASSRPTNGSGPTSAPSSNGTSPSTPRIFIAGDAAHTHSPKAAQGMNTALHDSWNLAWKLNLAVRGLCRPSILLGSYEAERRKIARDLVAFDFEHANEMSRGDPAALADNFHRNVRFISGVGVEYGENELNTDGLPTTSGAGARPGCTLPPGKVSRYIDANPVDVQLDVPVLGQFRVYMFVPDVSPRGKGTAFLHSLCKGIADEASLMSRLSAAATKSYLERPRVPSSEDLFIRPERYTAVSQLFAFALITTTPKSEFELTTLPTLLSRSPWTIYLDDVPDLDTQGSTCTVKYLGAPDVPGGFQPDREVAILNVRPDGYVGSVKKWSLLPDGATEGDKDGAEGDGSTELPEELGQQAAAWLETYFDRFLAVPER